MLKKYRLPTRLGSLSMQLTSSPLISTYHIRRRRPQVVGKTRRQQSAPRAQLSTSLDEALSAKRTNKQQIRALCELQQEAGFFSFGAATGASFCSLGAATGTSLESAASCSRRFGTSSTKKREPTYENRSNAKG